jgi:predicted RNA binding protein YcfA (HicA-like mRNA interferase family)
VKAREVDRRIEKLGGYVIRTRGSHRYYEAAKVLPDGTTVKALTSVAQHPGDVPTGTLAKIERDLEPVFGKGWLR